MEDWEFGRAMFYNEYTIHRTNLERKSPTNEKYRYSMQPSYNQCEWSPNKDSSVFENRKLMAFGILSILFILSSSRVVSKKTSFFTFSGRGPKMGGYLSITRELLKINTKTRHRLSTKYLLSKTDNFWNHLYWINLRKKKSSRLTWDSSNERIWMYLVCWLFFCANTMVALNSCVVVSLNLWVTLNKLSEPSCSNSTCVCMYAIFSVNPINTLYLTFGKMLGSRDKLRKKKENVSSTCKQ